MHEVEHRLNGMGLTLPAPWTPRGMFLPWRKVGDIIYISGQICERDGVVIVEGPVGSNCTVAQAQDAARLCALNLLYCVKQASGDLDNIAEVIRLGGFVNCLSGFADAPKVIDGASSLLIALLADAGRHVRTAVGVAGLPGNAAVEVDAIIRLKR